MCSYNGQKQSWSLKATHTHLMALGEPVQEKQNQSQFTGARDSEWQWQ